MDAPLTKPPLLAITYQPLVETTEHPLAEKTSSPVPGPREKDQVPEDFGRFYNHMVRPLERKFEDGQLKKIDVVIGGRNKAEDKLAKSHMAYLQRKADAMQNIKPVIDSVVQTEQESPIESDTNPKVEVMQDEPALETVPQTNSESSEDSSCGFFKKLKHWAIKVVKVVYKYTGLKFIVDEIKVKDKSEPVADAVQSKDETVTDTSQDEPEVVADTVKSKDESGVDKSKRKPIPVADCVKRVLEAKIATVDVMKARGLALQPDRAKMLHDLKIVQRLRGVVAPITPRTAESSPCSGQDSYDLSGLHRASTVFAEKRDKKALENIAEIEKKRAEVEANKAKENFAKEKKASYRSKLINPGLKYGKDWVAYNFSRKQESTEVVQKAKDARDIKMAKGHNRQDSQRPVSETPIVPSTVSPVTKEDPKADRYAAIRELDEQLKVQR
ncbi:hypothetical protein [Endozoicomonas acroporae]|uniref:hypothetical protein n=1 Tax=Endozoicomonas acroporae TaxID=1701104 RepID=UPI0013D30F45|nr:hypothetical protein [Endozoicomonas acroporae]